MRDDPTLLRDLLDDAGRRAGVDRARETGHLWRRWREIVGDEIADHAEPTSLRDGVLRLRASSSSWATEIAYLATEIRTRVNETLRAEVVASVRVWTAPSPGPGEARPRSGRTTPESREQHAVKPAPADPREALARARRAWEQARREHP